MTQPPAELPAAPDPWADYLAAAQRLDAVRTAASSVVTEQAQAVQAAQHELQGVRARLAPQRSRLVGDLGVPESELIPLPAEVAAAAQAVAGGPVAALAALRQARATADAADASMLTAPAHAPAPPWMRNLLVYGPFAGAVLIVQIVLYLIVANDSLPTYATVCGLSMPLLAFGLGWVTVGFVFGGPPPGGGPAQKVDRTPILGVVVCLTPVLVTCMGVGLMSLFH
jgi:hypothetical protein